MHGDKVTRASAMFNSIEFNDFWSRVSPAEQQKTCCQTRISLYSSGLACEREAGPSPAARLPPLQKFLVERRIPVRQRRVATCRPHAGGRRGWAAASGLLRGGRSAVRIGAVVLIEPGLRRVKTFPARQGGRQIHFAPFDVAWRLLEIADSWKEGLHEPLDPRVAIAIGLRLVKRDQDRTDRNRVDSLAWCNEVRIVVVREHRRRIVVVELIRIGDRN